MQQLIRQSLNMIKESCNKITVNNTSNEACKSAALKLSAFTGVLIMYSVLFFSLLISINKSFAQSDSGWVMQTVESYYYTDVWFTDSETGFIAGGYPKCCIYRTQDAGITWNQMTHPDESLYVLGICFADSLHGWAGTINSIILHTKDGGTTWTKQTNKAENSLESVFCIDTSTVFAVGSKGIIMHTEDGGNNWIKRESGQTSSNFDIIFLNPDTGIVVGGQLPNESTPAYILRTTDGGVSWETVLELDSIKGLYGIDFADFKTGIAVGTDGTILRTTDGGLNWTGQPSGTTVHLNDVFFLNADLGYVVGGKWFANNNGIVLCTQDGGKTWGTQAIPTTNSLFRTFFTSDTTGFAVGYEGLILRTIDGGGPITPVETTTGINLSVQTNCNLDQNYPNPFNLSTNIKFQIPENCHVMLKVYDINGQEVKALVNKEMVPGDHEVKWDAEDIPAGVYFYKLQAGSITVSKKLVLIR